MGGLGSRFSLTHTRRVAASRPPGAGTAQAWRQRYPGHPFRRTAGSPKDGRAARPSVEAGVSPAHPLLVPRSPRSSGTRFSLTHTHRTAGSRPPSAGTAQACRRGYPLDTPCPPPPRTRESQQLKRCGHPAGRAFRGESVRIPWKEASSAEAPNDARCGRAPSAPAGRVRTTATPEKRASVRPAVQAAPGRPSRQPRSVVSGCCVCLNATAPLMAISVRPPRGLAFPAWPTRRTGRSC
jgi:hypothetical protein